MVRISGGREGWTAGRIAGFAAGGFEASLLREGTKSAGSSSFTGTGRLQDLQFVVSTSGASFARTRVCTCPQYRHDRLMIALFGDGLAEAAFFSGMGWPQALHFADFIPGGILAWSIV